MSHLCRSRCGGFPSRCDGSHGLKLIFQSVMGFVLDHLDAAGVVPQHPFFMIGPIFCHDSLLRLTEI